MVITHRAAAHLMALLVAADRTVTLAMEDPMVPLVVEVLMARRPEAHQTVRLPVSNNV